MLKERQLELKTFYEISKLQANQFISSIFLRTQWNGGFYVNKEFLVGLKWSVKLRKVFPLSRDELFASHFVPESMNPCRLVDSRRHRFLWVTPRWQRSHFIEYQIDRFQFNKLFRVSMSWQQKRIVIYGARGACGYWPSFNLTNYIMLNYLKSGSWTIRYLHIFALTASGCPLYIDSHKNNNC